MQMSSVRPKDRLSRDTGRRNGIAICLAMTIVFSLGEHGRAEGLADASSFRERYAAVETPQATDVAPGRPVGDPPTRIVGGSRSSDAPIAGPAGRTQYRALIERETAGTGLASEIAEAVMAVESGYNPAAVGGVGEIGLMQILPSTARMLGFTGALADLAVPETNIHYGVTYLAQAWRLAGGDLCRAVMKYRAGHGETRFSHLSVNYCLAVRAKLFARGFQVTGTVPVATFGEPVAGGRSCRKCLGTTPIGHVNLAALNTTLSTLVMQVRQGR